MSVLPQTLLLPSRRPAPLRCPGSPAEPRLSVSHAAPTSTSVIARRQSLSQCRATSADPQQQEVETLDDATKIWGKQVREGKVQSINAKKAGEMISKGDWTMLDVRPQHEVDVAAVQGAFIVPLFVVDEDVSPGTFLKKASAFGMGGWWEGGTHMKPNGTFLRDVERKIPKNKKVIVACQKGLRSLAASEQLSRAGYRELAWINGGFETAAKGDLAITGAENIRLAGIGGLSKLLGWTEVQQETSKGFLGGSNNIIRFAIFILFLDGASFVYEQAKYFLFEKGH